MGGPDTIKGISYQNAYTLFRLMDLLNEEGNVQSIAVEGKGVDVEDLTITYVDDTEEVVQVKKRETREGMYGQWGLADIKPIVSALYDLTSSERKITTYRFVATGSAHAKVIAIQKACQRLCDKSFSLDKDGKAVSDVKEIISADDMSTIDFMRMLFIDIPLESKEHFEEAVQNRLMKEFDIPPKAVERVYNDLYKRVLDMGIEAEPDKRVIDSGILLEWMDNLQDETLDTGTLISIKQRVKEIRGQMTGIKAGEIGKGDIKIDQEIDTVEEGGSVTGVEVDKL